MKQFKSQVLSNREVASGYFQLDFQWNLDARPLAGQFLTIRVSELSSPLLRRPFALSNFNEKNNEASIIYQKIGTGTELLSQVKEGDQIDILAPLGNSFSQFLSPEDKSGKNHYIVAGGIGTGPMLYLYRELESAGYNPTLIIGCRTESLIPHASLEGLQNVKLCTDDGSYGYHGNVVQYLQEDTQFSENSIIYCCGPEPMLKGCFDFAEAQSAQVFVSLEQMMACGVGACMGCTCKTTGKKPYARVCKEGPVFHGRDIEWT